jgi:hypothetical protein
MVQEFLPFTSQKIQQRRNNLCWRIADFFRESAGVWHESLWLHNYFKATSLRARISEINRDPSYAIKIVNETRTDEEGFQQSFYRGIPTTVSSIT